MQSRTRVSFVLAWLMIAGLASADEPLRIATFQADATPALGEPVAYAPAREILDPLSARGIVLLPAGKPIVLCAVDWIGIGNDGHDAWREALAQAAGTTPQRVAVHTLHQHDGPRWDATAAKLLAARGLGGKFFSESFVRAAIKRTADSIRAALKNAQPVTHVGVGKAKVEKVASNRRILGPRGKVKIIRWSRMTLPAAIAAPEGTIDPYLQLLSFWNGEKPLASLTYYATHPQSYYGSGGVSADFVGMARTHREMAVPAAAHIHFNGAGGNVAAGKYNDGTPPVRPLLARRLAEGMKKAWEATKKTPITSADVGWNVVDVKLPLRDMYQDEGPLIATLGKESAPLRDRIRAARNIVWARRVKPIEVSCLRLGPAYVLHLPGELFVAYQVAAAAM